MCAPEHREKLRTETSLMASGPITPDRLTEYRQKGPYVWDGNWHFVAGTYDGAYVRFYVDGVEVTPATATSLTINYALPTNSNLYIGAYVAAGWCTLPFNG